MNEPTPRDCHNCMRPIGKRFPVVFLQRASGALLGPFHPKCAESVVKDLRVRATLTTPTASGQVVQVLRYEQGELFG